MHEGLERERLFEGLPARQGERALERLEGGARLLGDAAGKVVGAGVGA